MSHIGYLRHHDRLAQQRASHKEERENMFSTPSAPSGGIKWEDVKGELLMVEPLSIESDIQTSFGPASAVKANVTVIKADGTGEVHDDCLIFPKVLASQVRSQIGAKVLGRLGQGTAKPGQSAPWMLNEATPDDIAKAEAYVKQNVQPAVTSARPPF